MGLATAFAVRSRAEGRIDRLRAVGLLQSAGCIIMASCFNAVNYLIMRETGKKGGPKAALSQSNSQSGNALTDAFSLGARARRSLGRSAGHREIKVMKIKSAPPELQHAIRAAPWSCQGDASLHDRAGDLSVVPDYRFARLWRFSRQASKFLIIKKPLAWSGDHASGERHFEMRLQNGDLVMPGAASNSGHNLRGF
jgi:hypothetical protein